MSKLLSFIFLLFIFGDQSFCQTNLADSTLLKKIVIVTLPFWDFNQGWADSQIIENKVFKLVTYTTNNLDSIERVTDITEYNQRGQFIRDIGGNNILKDSIDYDASYKYDETGILIESQKKIYRNFQEWGDYIDKYNNSGDYLGRRFKINSDSTVTMISKYHHDLNRRLTRVDRYYPDGEFAESRPLLDTISIITDIKLPDSTLIDNVKTVNYRSSDGDYKLIDIYSPNGQLLKEYKKESTGKISGDSVVYSYNHLGKLKETITYIRGVKSGMYHKIIYTNDSLPCKEFSTKNFINDSTMDEIKTFDINGNMVREDSWVNGRHDHRVVKYIYNSKGLIIKEIHQPYYFNHRYDFVCRKEYTYY